MKTSKFFTPALIVGVFLSIVVVVFAFDFIIGGAYREYTPGEPDTAPTLPAPPAPPESLSSSVTANSSSVSDTNEYWSLKVTEIMEYSNERTPALEYACPYEVSKCVGTMDFAEGDEHLTTWDIYIYSLDGVIGTWIVNEGGNDLSFYGDAFLYFLGNTNVHLGSCVTDGEKTFYEGHLCVYPNRDTDVNDFMVVTYPWEAKLPLVAALSSID